MKNKLKLVCDVFTYAALFITTYFIVYGLFIDGSLALKAKMGNYYYHSYLVIAVLAIILGIVKCVNKRRE